MQATEAMTEAEFELYWESQTVDCCVICGRTYYLSEMSECKICGHFCSRCDCRCSNPVFGARSLSSVNLNGL
jgi:hypothetical protein